MRGEPQLASRPRAAWKVAPGSQRMRTRNNLDRVGVADALSDLSTRPSLCRLCCSAAPSQSSPSSFRRTHGLTSPKATPLYAGLQTARTQRHRARTPLPAPERAVALREAARDQFSKSASFPYDAQPPTLASVFATSGARSLQQTNGGAAAAAAASSSRPSAERNTHRNGAYYNNAFSLQPVAVFDPQLPSPIVVVHQSAKNGFNKSVQERKHRGISRNVLGGYYTS